MPRTRVVTSCQTCRVLHLKCDSKIPSCARCLESSRECIRGVNVRFRHEGGSHSLPNQTWLRVPAKLQYYNEVPELKRIYENGIDTIRRQQEGGFRDSSAETFWEDGSSPQRSAGFSPCPNERPPIPAHNNNSMTIETDSSDQYQNSPNELASFDGQEIHNLSPNQDSLLNRSNWDSTHESPQSIKSLNTSYPHSPFTPREAILMQNFINNMALWADVADLSRHFEIEVPQRALKHLILRYAIFAFSSRHLSRFNNYEETEAMQYHDKCLQLLIPIVSDSGEGVDEEVFASIAILRQYEEMDAYDQHCHLLGSTQVLNTISGFSSSGGLGEASAWLCLRQDIYISVVYQRPLKTHLQNFLLSQTFIRNDDVSWANRMVFLLAKLLSCAFLPEGNVDEVGSVQVPDEIARWNDEKPVSFQPILFKSRSKEEGRLFPDIWLLSPFHVIGMQYFHIAQIVLAISFPKTRISGYGRLGEARMLENTVRNHLLVILGLAVSNKRAENALYTAKHALSAWGGVLRDQLDQDATVEFLRNMEGITGWRMNDLIQSLRAQWTE